MNQIAETRTKRVFANSYLVTETLRNKWILKTKLCEITRRLFTIFKNQAFDCLKKLKIKSSP
jgi:hypothetical protein